MAPSNAELNQQAVRNIVRGLATNDLRPLVEALDEDVVWISHSPPAFFRFGGEHRGRIGAMELLAKIYADFSFIRYETDGLVQSGDEIWAINNIVVHHRPSDRTASLRLSFRMTFRDGKLTRYEGFFDSASALAQMGRLPIPGPRPALPPPPHKGGCLCGAVRWQLNARPLGINACHCDDCRKLTGAANLLMLLARSADFTHEGKTERYRKRADSGREIDIVRCANCGVRLWHEPLSSPEFVFVAAGTLDDPGWAIPTSHIWIEKAAPGTQFAPDALLVEGQPASRHVLFDAFSRVYPG